MSRLHLDECDARDARDGGGGVRSERHATSFCIGVAGLSRRCFEGRPTFPSRDAPSSSRCDDGSSRSVPEPPLGSTRRRWSWADGQTSWPASGRSSSR
jgi:hypothetical protein